MNIFYLNEDPVVAAQKQYNKHVVKMILESAQLLCAAHHIHESEVAIPYKLTHKNHPSSVWTRESKQNYKWLHRHMMALGEEYSKRYGKTHLTITKCGEVLAEAPQMCPDTELTQMPQCMPEEYMVQGDSVLAYRNYYLGEKSSICNEAKEKMYNNINQFN